ncbi:MAG: prepilin peptidase [Candidatus Palauibacterales bacterium]|nr:prepilin peptidase [Candidatus Palauibacterales bacterium]MDP2583645.1 prepilin peptidase [Candidatus Palauibacterales bacterium]
MLAELTLSALVLLAAGAAWCDVRERRIPNALTAAGLVGALLLRVPLGLAAIWMGLAGAGIALALSLVFFLAGGMGGGDVKLLVAVGAFLGPHRLWPGLLAMALTGGLMAAWLIVRRGAMAETAANIHTLWITLGRRTFTGWKGEESEAALTLDTPGALTVPYGVAIAVGALVGWFM